MLDRTSPTPASIKLIPMRHRRSAAAPIVIPSNNLDTLIANARKYHRSAKRAIDFAVKAGKALLDAKEIVGHGSWERWLEGNREKLGFSPRTARLYMQLTELPQSKRQRVADLSLREAARIAALPDGNQNGQSAQRHQRPPRPTLNSHCAILVDAAIQLGGGSDVVLGYIRDLPEEKRISLPKFDAAVRRARQKLAAANGAGARQ